MPSIDAQFGQKAKDIFAGRWPVTSWIFDAVSLGIQTALKFRDFGLLAAISKPSNRTERDPNDSDKHNSIRRLGANL
jgi:hypothetical protein